MTSFAVWMPLGAAGNDCDGDGTEEPGECIENCEDADQDGDEDIDDLVLCASWDAENAQSGGFGAGGCDTYVPGNWYIGSNDFTTGDGEVKYGDSCYTARTVPNVGATAGYFSVDSDNTCIGEWNGSGGGDGTGTGSRDTTTGDGSCTKNSSTANMDH